ncbi:MAG: DUF362 domain-containing protein [Deltaproteobacteria bacterium]|nr:DUF362 domain-containing protein [Deltaproteobacteria bacterium]
MSNQTSNNEHWIDSPLGRRLPDSSGSPVGVARLDPEKSYAGAGVLLQEVINESSEDAWKKIKAKIDYTYEGLEYALAPLTEKTDLEKEVRERLNQGQKMLFKPNLVSTTNIDSQTHGPGLGATACTEWPFVAALMRWFHDKLGVRYHQMSLGEAATAMASSAGLFSMTNPEGKTITTEAVIEGRSGHFYGGWGFYFARKYLSECPGTDPADDPMRGHEASLAGTYTPPGQISNELRVIDLNRIETAAKGREVPVPGGINFDSITLHKDIIGGDPADKENRKAYPGCILINVSKLKVHTNALFTNVIKNLGIGLYPMQFSRGNDCCWEYASPHRSIPGIKGGIPHDVWVAEMDPETCIPVVDESGKPKLSKTGGLTATMIDIVKAVQNQDVFMIHVVDAIVATNLEHGGSYLAKKESEGLIFAGLDPVATDLLCARYMFSNVPLKEALEVNLDDGAGGSFPQSVPIPALVGGHIITGKGYDCPLSRDNCFEQAEKRGLGKRSYRVLGWDRISNGPLLSIDGHLGLIKEGAFADIITRSLYFNLYKFPWDLQKTAFGYLSAVDEMAGSSLKKTFLEAFDENEDGVVSYWETGQKGFGSIFLHQAGYRISCMGMEPLGFLSGGIKSMITTLKLRDPQRNSRGYDFTREFSFGAVCMAGFRMSQMEMERPDLFVPGLTWGKGNWPSFQMAQFNSLGNSIYGLDFPFQPGFPSLYGSLVYYTDLTQNEGKYLGGSGRIPDPEKIRQYVAAVQKGQDQPMDFILYVPTGFDRLGGSPMPNVEATDDPAKVLTVRLRGGQEIWGEI